MPHCGTNNPLHVTLPGYGGGLPLIDEGAKTGFKLNGGVNRLHSRLDRDQQGLFETEPFEARLANIEVLGHIGALIGAKLVI